MADGKKERVRGGRSIFTVTLVLVVITLFWIAATHFGLSVLSAFRAYTVAESRWTNAQKQAVGHLLRYIVEQQPESYARFTERLELHAAFQTSRRTLLSDTPDRDLARRGFQTADLHPKDIELLLLPARFRAIIPYIGRAFEIWREGDDRISDLRRVAQDAQSAVEDRRIDAELTLEFLHRIEAVDQSLTDLQTSFNATITEGAQAIQTVFLRLLVAAGAGLIVTGYAVTSFIFRKTTELTREIAASESKFRRVLEHSRDVVYELDLESGAYDYMSPAVKSVLGYTLEEIQAGGLNFIIDRMHPEDRKRMEKEILEAKGVDVEQHFTKETEYRVRTGWGEYIWINNRRMLVQDTDGQPVAIVGAVRDITAQKEHEALIHKSLDENRTLLAEIHHRVKNNLAVVTSLLSLQKNKATGESYDILHDAESRISSIAMIHEKLYQSDSFAEVNMKEYIAEFVRGIARAYAPLEASVVIKQNVEAIHLDMTRAVPLGLILNELLNNAYKHGFAHADGGELTINFERHDDTVVLRVSDNGSGLPAGFNLDDTRTLGMTLVQTLTSQLRGTLEVTQNDLTTFQIEFPIV